VSNEGGAPRTGRRNWLALSGLLFVALVTAAFTLISSIPGVRDSQDTVTAFYSNPASITNVLAAAYLVPIAGIIFLVFMGVLRIQFSPVRERGERFRWTVVNGSGILFIACLFIATAVAASPAASVTFLGAPPPSTTALAPVVEVSSLLLFLFSMRSAASFMIFASLLGLQNHSLPRWLTIAGLVLGLALLLSITYASAFLLLLPVWVAAASIYMFLRPAARDS